MCNDIHAMCSMQHATESVQQKKLQETTCAFERCTARAVAGLPRHAPRCMLQVARCRRWAVHLINEGRPPLARRRHMHLSEQEARPSFRSLIRIISTLIRIIGTSIRITSTLIRIIGTSIRIISTLIRIIGTPLDRQRCQKLSEEEAHQRTPLGLSMPSLSATVTTIAIRTTQVSSGTHRRPKGLRPHGVRCGMCVNICAGIAAPPHLRGGDKPRL